jgi:hypothetical protein
MQKGNLIFPYFRADCYAICEPSDDPRLSCIFLFFYFFRRLYFGKFPRGKYEKGKKGENVKEKGRKRKEKERK